MKGCFDEKVKKEKKKIKAGLIFFSFERMKIIIIITLHAESVLDGR